MTKPNHFICIGAAHWDIIARSDVAMYPGSDVPGKVTRQLGGVALNVALALARQDQNVSMLTAIGGDQHGKDLIMAMRQAGLNCAAIATTDTPSDSYVAIEANGELYGAVADCRALESAGLAIVQSLAQLTGTIIADCNLPEIVLAMLPHGTIFVPASPNKASRLRSVLRQGKGAVYANRQEAEVVCETVFSDALKAATALVRLGATRATVTDGPHRVADCDGATLTTATPPTLNPTTATGAGDTFLAVHLVALHSGLDIQSALDLAVAAAANRIVRQL